MIAEGKSLVSQITEGIGDSIQWFLDLDPTFAFLLALPFVVGFVGLLSEYLTPASRDA